jgi:hypothetical protein
MNGWPITNFKMNSTKKRCLNPHWTIPKKKGEHVGLSSTCNRVLSLRYLLWSNFCHISSLDRSLNSHMLSKHLFLNLRTSTPSLPWSFGQQMMLHLVNLYFFLVSWVCQKNLDQKKCRHFLTPLGIWRNESINIGKLAKTELIRTK